MHGHVYGHVYGHVLGMCYISNRAYLPTTTGTPLPTGSPRRVGDADARLQIGSGAQTLGAMGGEQFQEAVAGLVSKKRQTDRNIHDMCERWMHEVATAELVFDRPERGLVRFCGLPSGIGIADSMRAARVPVRRYPTSPPR